MIVITMVGLLATIAIPSYIKHLRRTRTVEAVWILDRVKVGARDYFVTDHWTSAGQVPPRQFPGQVNQVPVTGPCCTPCVTPQTVWDSQGWDPLKFGLVEPHRYAVTFTTNSHSTLATYVARAVGDLDCDGTTSTFEVRGYIDGEGEVVAAGPIITRLLE